MADFLKDHFMKPKSKILIATNYILSLYSQPKCMTWPFLTIWSMTKITTKQTELGFVKSTLDQVLRMEICQTNRQIYEA